MDETNHEDAKHEEQKLEFGKQAPDIPVSTHNLPSRKEMRKLIKTGKDSEGHEIHPQDMKDLRRATIGDFKNFGQLVNFANQNLKKYVDDLVGQNQWVLLNFIAYLTEKGILPATAPEEFAKYTEDSKKEIEGAKEFLKEKKILEAEVKSVETELCKKEDVGGKQN